MKKGTVVLFAMIGCLVFAGQSYALSLNSLEKLGQQIYEDKNLSSNQNQSCATCHHSSAQFADPDNVIAPMARPVSQGSDAVFFGGRNAPSAAYAAFSPKLHWNSDDGLFIGGVFADGRASGQDTTATAQGDELGLTSATGDPLADQAKGPFLNAVEMGLTRLEEVVDTVLSSSYRSTFLKFFSRDIYDAQGELNYPAAYNKIAEAIAAFERSSALNQFSSRFDKFVKEQGGDVSEFGIVYVGDFRKYVGPPENFKSKYLSYDEADGLALFNADSDVQLNDIEGNAGGMCYLCHLTERHDPDYGENSTQGPNPTEADGSYPPLLTDFSYDNLGIPANPRIAELAGPQSVDFGLGDASRYEELYSLNKRYSAADEEGKFKVPSLRNVAGTAPYGHNGFFPTLYSIVHFYNARDNGIDVFPDPEVAANVNKSELGKLGLNFEQEKKIVLFLQTLSD